MIKNRKVNANKKLFIEIIYKNIYVQEKNLNF